MKPNTAQPLRAVIVSTRYGWVGIVLSESRVKRLTLPCNSRSEVLRQIKDIPVNIEQANAKESGNIPRQIEEYFMGQRDRFDCELDLSGSTPFQRAVWQSAMEIPYGEIRSYQWVARRIGKMNAYRAAGQALARNPIPIIIPCHRVIYSGGKLGGFGGKANIKDFKRRLLSLEGAQIPDDLEHPH